MSLQDLVNNFGSVKEYSLEEKNESKRLGELLTERKYNLLRQFLEEREILTTGNLKSLSLIEYNNLKAKIPSLAGVGEDKTDLFLNKLDEIRNTKYTNSSPTNTALNYGIIGAKNKWHIEINKLSYQNADYIDIRKIGPDGSRGKGISINIKDFPIFKEIVNSVELNENNDCLLKVNIDPIESNNKIKIEDKYNNDLKKLILKNEENLLSLFGNDYGINIKLFKKKIEALRYDGDIVKFLNNDSILEIKKEFYDLIHKYNQKTAVDLMNEYPKENLLYTSIKNLEIGEKVNTMTICALANNFNMMLGMYYNQEENILILKSQTRDGDYHDKWINETDLVYYLQNEKEEKYQSLEFSHQPNQICRDIILKLNSNTKVYLFTRNNKDEEYIYHGEVTPVKFLNNNKCILITIN